MGLIKKIGLVSVGLLSIGIFSDSDDISEPEKKFVVAIEGEKCLIDSVYEEIEKII